MFEDREDAGRRLALALDNYRGKDAVVLAIPNGAVPVAHQVARYLHAQLDVVIARKLPYFNNHHAGFGSVAEDGSVFIFPSAFETFSKETINKIIHEQQDQVFRAVGALRAGNELPNIEGKTVILIDDGISMGSNMRVCITLCKNKKAERIIVATPVSGADNAKKFETLADEAIILETPDDFFSVSQVYANWQEVSDRQVIGIMRQWEYEKQRIIGH